jgi:xylulokinase
LRLRELMPHTQVGEVRVMGGGARSQLWNKIKSDVLGIPYRKLAREDLATLGSAQIAGHAVGIYPDLAAVAKSCARAGDVQEPNKSANRTYRAYSALYARLYDTIRETFGALTRISQRPA